MSAQTKEALAAVRAELADTNLPHIPRRELAKAYFETLVDDLEAAQQEAEAWEAIEAFVNDRGWGCYVSRPAAFGTWGVRIAGDTQVGKTRLEALTKAATWCRAELAK